MKRANIYNKVCAYGMAALLLLLAGCSADDATHSKQTGQSEQQAVSFATSFKETTRASTGTIDNLDALKATPEGFGVFAYLTDGTAFATKFPNADSYTTFADFFMYNQQVTWGVQYVENDENEDPADDVTHYDWVYAPLKYWPNSTENSTSRYISFFAYAPYVAATGATEGITSFTRDTDRSPHIVYKIAGGNEQVDLLWANCIDATRNGKGLITSNSSPLEYQKIPLTFHPALAAVDIYVQRVYDEPVYTGNAPTKETDIAKMYISKLDLVSATGAAALQTGGKLSLVDGTWSTDGSWSEASKTISYTESMIDDYVKGTTSTDALVIRDTELGKFDEESGIDKQERLLIKGAMSQVFLPRKVTLIPTITYSMVNQDDDLAIGYYTDLRGQKYSRIVNQVTGNSLTIDFEAGKRYKVLIRIGVEHVSFEVASIVDWDFPLRYNPEVVSDFGNETIGHRLDEEDR